MPAPNLAAAALLVVAGGLLELLLPGTALICAHICIGAAITDLVSRCGKRDGNTIYAAGSESALDRDKSFWMRLGEHP